MIAAGTLRANPDSYQWGKTKDGKSYIATVFQILTGPDTGKTITWFGFMTPAAGDITMKALRACGWKGTDLYALGTLDQQVELVVEHEEYEGKLRAKVKWVNSAGGIDLKAPMSADEIRLMSAKWSQKAANIKEITGKKAETPTVITKEQPAADTADRSQDNEIPF